MWACFKNRACMPLPLMGSLVGVFLMAQVDGLILMPPGQTMLCLILAWAFACHTRGISEVNQKVIPNWFGLLFLGLGGLSFAVMLWVGLPLLMQMNLIMLNFFSHCNDSCMLSPNYWSQGFIAYY
jgi:hypothetical protein